MKRNIFALCSLLFALCVADAMAQRAPIPRAAIPMPLTGVAMGNQPSDFISPAAFNNMEPFLSPQMRGQLQPAGTARAPNQNAAVARAAFGSGNVPSANLIPAITQGAHHNAPAPQRQVVQRPGTGANVARAAAAPVAVGGQIQQPQQPIRQATGGQQRQVVARRAGAGGAPPVVPIGMAVGMTSEQCLAEYTRCMDDFCARPNHAYNRCFCSPRLAEIQNRYRSQIDNVLRMIIVMQNGGNVSNNMTDAEMEYWWAQTVATGHNTLLNLNAALNATDFADFESTARGQVAFNTGHEFCVRNLPACFYAAQNMIGIYRNAITRDCATYEARMRQTLRFAEQTLLQLGGELN